ncbi:MULTISPECIES: shikimate kinase [Bacillaceae]|uniref:shikimate kinase n=1 Tax=Bacillaceae TaxID=186817 RepID=UPI001C57C398|nr:shikimate kinase [Rossellomorea sp. YZS02]MBW3113593.1 shikimate kinase [Bacillus sp. MCCB 382]MDX8344801.1 shikimate kinase [Rossellomorea sp. YZS02]
MKPIFFVGFMGVGKTTVGKRLGEVLNLPVIDLDQYIETKEKKSIRDIFHQHGETYFRELETSVLQELKKEMAIITTGGGIVEREENRAFLRNCGSVFHLTCPFGSLWKRLEGDQDRPLVQRNSKTSLKELYERRLPLYESGSTVTIFTEGKSVDEVVELILPYLQHNVV